MQIAQFDEVPESIPVGSGFRGGSIRFKDLLQGEEGQPDNFGLQWVTVDDAFHTPPHRHNFEQVRILVEGSFGFGPQQIQSAGTVGYFCEGTLYAQNAKGRSETLLLQVGGPSGNGFLSRRQLCQAVADLAKQGSFSNGLYSWIDGQGQTQQQDSFEACWEHVHGRAIVYPKPQFRGPVLMQPERFCWVDDDQPKVAKRVLGRFNERGLEIAQRRIAAGCQWTLTDTRQAWLLVAVEGAGELQSGSRRDPLGWRTSVHCKAGEQLTIAASQALTLWCLGLPNFKERTDAATPMLA